MTKILLPKLLEKKGVIVNLSSVAAELGAPMYTVYNATKVTFSSLITGTYMYNVVHHILSVCEVGISSPPPPPRLFTIVVHDQPMCLYTFCKWGLKILLPLIILFCYIVLYSIMCNTEFRRVIQCWAL